jgi:hypothetical protein
MFRLTRSQLAAFLAVSCSSTTVWGQLPANRISPINQINRAWGFWVSDGYHECPKPKKQRHAINRSQSVLDNFDPIGGSLYKNSSIVVPQTHAIAEPSVKTMPMTTLPVQPYSQFATPAETPLPGSHYSPQTPPPLPQLTPAYPSNPQPSYPNFPSDDRGYVPSPLPDPITSEPIQTTPSPNSQPYSTTQPTSSDAAQEPSELDLLGGSDRTQEVPPSPPLRQRLPSDKPLGEIPDSWTPPEKKQSQPQSDQDRDEDLNLLTPNNVPPPITYDYNRPNGILAGWRNHENYPPNYQQASQQPSPQAYQQQPPVLQPYRQVSQPVMPPGSRSLMQREQAPTNASLRVQVQPVPSYSSVQNPYAQYNVNRYP